MNTYRSGTTDMRDFAQLRVNEAERTLAEHHPDGVGCCASCGRPAPCDDMIAAGQSGQHYREWLDAAPTWVDEGHPFGRVRPFVLVERGRGHHRT
jgi:hypothetical protein